LARTGLTATVVAADLRDWQPSEPVDAILLDAPCSATGIFRRHPDVLHRVGPRQIAEMADLQAALLDRASGWLKPGGRLVYATCSLEPEEGETQIAALLARRGDMRPAAIDGGTFPAGLGTQAPGQLRTLPGLLSETGGLDGFFVALLERN
ncbi:MAG TPA: SAM-dependent methyltransferase, partial [Sphingobium sp.]|nr:SAM-dependent methyltransferase [Sphingobium sp.]